MREKLDAYYKALEVIKVLGQALLGDEDFLPEDMTEVIEDIDMAVHCLLHNVKGE